MDNKYYVYVHSDPLTKEIMYIGHGHTSRAWAHGHRKTVARSKDHGNWIEYQTKLGNIPSDWVSIVLRNISKKEACKKEQELIRELKPIFNKPQGLGCLKLTKEQLEIARKKRSGNISYKEIGEHLGLSTMTVWRGLNGKTKNVY